MAEKLATKSITYLSEAEPGTKKELYAHVLFDEPVVFEFNAARAVLVVTDKKLIAVDVQGITGKKKEVLVIPFSKITAFSAESAGTFDLDLEVKVWASGVGMLEFTFIKGTKNFTELTTHLAKYIG